MRDRFKSCSLFRCCSQTTVTTRFVQDGDCVSPVTIFHCRANWRRGLDVAVAWHPLPFKRTNQFFYSSQWFDNMFCCVPGTILIRCQLCFHLAKKAMGCWSVEFFPPCFHWGLNDWTFLPAKKKIEIGHFVPTARLSAWISSMTLFRSRKHAELEM